MAIILLGIGSLPKYLVIALAAFLPTVVAIQQGVTDVDITLLNAARVLGAKQGTIFRRVVIPAVMPMAFTGMRIALGNSWATLVAAELIASQSGLGYITLQGQLYFDIPEIIIGILLIGTLGVMMDRLIYVTQVRLTSWQERR
jgi:NitT/TauT family transport system permease protein